MVFSLHPSLFGKLKDKGNFKKCNFHPKASDRYKNEDILNVVYYSLDIRWQIANEMRNNELAIIIPFPTNASGIIVLLKRDSVKEKN